MQRRLSIFAVLLAAFVWRNGRAIKNFMVPTEFPEGYYAQGNYSTQCTPVVDEANNEMRFCEDAAFWEYLDANDAVKEKDILVSCDPNRKAWNTVMGPLRDPNPRGALWIYSPGNPKAKPQRVAFVDYPDGHDFHPLGLEIWPSKNGEPSNLYVVNHARARSTIEHFVLSPAAPTQAKWVRTLTHRWFVAPNALALTSPTSFYLTNDHLMTRRLPKPLSSFLPILESVLGLPFAWLGHVSLSADGSIANYTFAALGIPFANGVAIAPGGKTLAVASSSMGTVYTYARDPKTNALSFARGVATPVTPDNLRYDEHGALIVAGHPHFPTLIKLAASKTEAAPSWVVKITERPQPEAGAPGLASAPTEFDTRAPVSAAQKVPAVLTHELETLFQSSGAVMSSSSTGLLDSATGKLFVTGLYGDPGMVVCTPSS